jgi:hypothetical protein
MENFFKWVTTPISPDDVEVWFSMNNMNSYRRDLFADFCVSLYDLIDDTYLGSEKNTTNKNDFLLTDEEKKNHFEWCWNKIIKNFQKENIHFNEEGDHKKYMSTFLSEVFYNQKDVKVTSSVRKFFEILFDDDKPFTKSDLDMLTEIYKCFDKNVSVDNKK